MAEVTIVYKELEDAAKKSREIDQACGDYEEELQEKVFSKIGSVSASPLPAGNTRLETANTYVLYKKQRLDVKGTKYKNFADKCEKLSTNAQNADKRVGQQVNNSRNKFLKDHPGLKEDGWNAFIATIIADVPILGWIVDKVSDVKDRRKDIKNTIRKWYEIDGGKKIVDTVLAVVGVVVAVVCAVNAVVGAISAVIAVGAAAATVAAVAGAVLSAIAAVIGAVGAIIGVVNAATNLATQIRADECKDPAFSNFYGEQDDLATVLKKKTWRGEQRKWNNGSMAWANGLEVTEKVCAVVSIVKGITDIAKSTGFRELFANKVKGKDLKGNEMDVYKFDFTKFKKTVTSKDGRKQIGKTLKKNWKKIAFGDDYKTAMTKDFDEAAKIKNVKDLDDLKKVTGAYARGAKLIKAGADTGERRFKAYLYNEYDIAGEIDTVISVTGTEGAVDITNSIYGEIKDAVGFDDKIKLNKVQYKYNRNSQGAGTGGGGGGGGTWGGR